MMGTSEVLTITSEMKTVPLDEECVAHRAPGTKREHDEAEQNEDLNPTRKKQRTRTISWSPKPEIHVQENPLKSFDDYDENEIWYSRMDYEDFLLDRLRTIQFLRSSRGNNTALDSESFCVRGLEPFQTPSVQQEFRTKRRFHQSTILIEQVQQPMLGIRVPERFCLMVGPQSSIALRRAQELAALDEHEVYGRVGRRRSLATSSPPQVPKSAEDSPSSSINADQLSLSQRLQQLQEWHAKRLVEMYSKPGNNPFRFPLRRDSLIGTSRLGLATNPSATMGVLPIRRDSLTPMMGAKEG